MRSKDPQHVALRLPTMAHADHLRSQAKKRGITLSKLMLYRLFTPAEDQDLRAVANRAERKATGL